MPGKRKMPMRTVNRRAFFSFIGKGVKRGLREVGREVTTFKGPLSQNPISRRALLVRAGVGAGLILGAVRHGRRFIFEAVFPQKKYRVNFVFLRHETQEDANSLRPLIENAIREGKPFHCLATEGAGEIGISKSVEQRTNQQIMNLHKRFQGKTKPQQDLLEQEIYSKVLDQYLAAGGSYPNYKAQQTALCCRYGLYVKFVELYSQQDYEKSVQLTKKREALASQLDKLSKEAISLQAEQKLKIQQQMKTVLQEFLYAHAREMRYRNRFLLQGVSGLDVRVKEEHPELKKQKQIRVMCVSGLYHEKLFEDAYFENYWDFESERHVYKRHVYKYPNFEKTSELMLNWVKLLAQNPNLKIPDNVLSEIVQRATSPK